MNAPASPMTLVPRRLDDFFSRSVLRFGDRVALERPAISVHDKDVCLTYRELEQAADQLAARIRLFVAPDDIVMLAFPRTDVDVYVSLLAVLKAGAAYCALDLTFPDDRVRSLILDSDPKLILASESCKSRFQELAESHQRVLSPQDLRASKSVASRAQKHVPSNLAYVIYTSGTTGRPKGVMIEHGQISNLIAANLTDFDLGPADRILQGSSLSYDSSVEEIFLAWAAGGTIVVGSDETVRLGPDLAPWLKQRKITVFAPPPTLLRTMGGSKVSRGLTDLRMLYVGGEALTKDVVDAWAPNRLLVNGYGPTECSVTVVRGEVSVQDERITIGAPIQGHQAYVLDENLNPVAVGEKGELCLSGVGLARGYLKRPELTIEKFPTLPGMGRVYRTGDLVSEESDGQFLYHGRIDTQVKLRGYRVELTSIEAHLCEVFGINSAACSIQENQGKQSLVAFVSHERPKRFSERALKKRLSDILPSYMVPSRIALVDELPKLTSGKIDRKSLPTLELTHIPDHVEKIRPRSADETTLASSMARALGENEPICVERDFFEQGGDSLAAALLVSELRSTEGFESLTVRDVYLHRTAAALAELNQEMRRAPQAFEKLEPPSNDKNPHVVTACQSVLLILSGLVAIATLFAISFMALPLALEYLPAWLLILSVWFMRPLLGWLWLPISVLLTSATKALLIGKYSVGCFPVWGNFYFRHWCVRLLSMSIPWRRVQGTFLHNWVLRKLGAKIGRDVYLHRGVKIVDGGWDLVSIGDGATIGRDVAIRPLEYVQLEGHLGAITIGSNAVLETRAGVSRDGWVGANAEVAAHACVRPLDRVPDNSRWLGSVGEVVETIHESNRSEPLGGYGELGYFFRLQMSQAVLSILSSLPNALLVVGLLAFFQPSGESVLNWLFAAEWQSDGLLLALGLLVVLSAPSNLLVSALLARLIGGVALGRFPIRSAPFIRAWLKESLMESASRWLSGTLLWPYWLRLSGMNVGRDCEISTIMEVVPEHVTLDGACFSADGIYLSVPPLAHGTVTYRETRYEKGVFLGNHAVIEAGSTVPKGVLLGVCTVAPEEMPAGTSWFGTPTFELPNREVVVMDVSLTHEPSLTRYVVRLFWELLRFSMPLLALLLTIAWFRFASPVPNTSAFEGIWHGLAVGVGLSLVSVTSVWCLKWGLLGRVKPGQHGLWSSWCSRWDFVYVFWGAFARPILTMLEGTQLLNAVLRTFGVKIGKRVFLGGGFAQVVDPDMLNFEDNTTVVNLFQAHSFEDRVLKIAPVYIEASSSVGEGTVMLYGARVGRGSVVGEQSVVMKNEMLSQETCFAGAPTRPMNRVVLSPRREKRHKAFASVPRAV